MWRNLITLAVCIISLGINVSYAESVPRKEALQVARLFFNAAYGDVMSDARLVYNGKNLTTDCLFPPFYVYAHPAGGYVVISGDNKAFPVLAFDVKGSFDSKNINEDFSLLLKRYARDVELIRYDHRIPVEAIAAWTDVRSSISEALSLSDSNNGKFYLESAVEFSDLDNENLTGGEDSMEEVEEEPFSFYDTFIQEMHVAVHTKDSMISEGLQQTAPVVKNIGGGHYEIALPEDVSIARIYSLQGMQSRVLSFNNTNIAVISLDHYPPGFYFVLLSGESGKNYGVKLLK